MTIVAIRPRVRERRERPRVESSRHDLTDLMAKTAATALPLVDADGTLPVRFVDDHDATRIENDLDGLRTLRKARFALDALRSAGVRGYFAPG